MNRESQDLLDRALRGELEPATWQFVDVEQHRDGWWAIGHNYIWRDRRTGAHYGPFATQAEADAKAEEVYRK